VRQAEQRLLRQRSSAKVNSAHEQCADSSRRIRAAPEGAPDSEQCLSGAPRSKSSNGRNRQNPNSWVTWLAHRIVSGGRPSTIAFPNGLIGGWGYKYPPTTSTPSIHYSSFNTRAIHNTPRHKSKSPIKSKSTIQL
jgi:hypothetical protein